MSSAGFSQTVTYSDILLCDPLEANAACGTATSGVSLSINSGTPVSTTLIDLDAGTNITLSQNGAHVTINAAGGGSGCTLPGINNVVLEEHPIATCVGTLQYTWDAANANIQVASSGNANTVGSHDTYIIGPANNLTGARFASVLGGSNTIQSMSGIALDDEFITVVGSGNSVGDVAHANSGGKDNTIIGNQSAIYNASWVQVLGVAGIGIDGGAGTETFGFSVGGANAANCIQGPVCGSSGAGTVTSFGLMGDNNLINWHGSGTVSGAYAGGNDNRFDTTIGNLSGVDTMWGFDNEIDGAVGNDVHIFGTSNTAHNSGTATCLSASDSVISGAINVITGSGNYMIFGGENTVTSHNCVAMFGMNMTASADNTAYFGMSPVPGLSITASNGLGTGDDNVRRTPLVFSKLPACAAGTEGSFASITNSNSATNGVVITGGGTNHVLGYCDGTNWKVVVGT
jgi:hypothetical protein